MNKLFKINLAGLNGLFAHIAKDMELFAPIRQGNELNYKKWHDGLEVDLYGLKTVNTPKDVLLPQSENLYAVNTKGGNIDITPYPLHLAPYTLLGAKACDIKAIAVLDNIYLRGDFVDEAYKSRRENAYIVSLACNEPKASCFCGAFGLDASNPGGDVATWIVDDELYLRPQNERGQEWVQKVAHLLGEANEELLNHKKHETHVNINLERFVPENTLELFKDANWEHLYKACLGCGICTYICPTCSCYDIRDFEGKCGEIQRLRCWDSCMYPDFTLMAHGNPRISQKERFRQRFMHKLVYHFDKFGEYGCVGCGRCVNKCPVNLNIVKIINTLGGAING